MGLPGGRLRGRRPLRVVRRRREVGRRLGNDGRLRRNRRVRRRQRAHPRRARAGAREPRARLDAGGLRHHGAARPRGRRPMVHRRLQLGGRERDRRGLRHAVGQGLRARRPRDARDGRRRPVPLRAVHGGVGSLGGIPPLVVPRLRGRLPMGRAVDELGRRPPRPDGIRARRRVPLDRAGPQRAARGVRQAAPPGPRLRRGGLGVARRAEVRARGRGRGGLSLRPGGIEGGVVRLRRRRVRPDGRRRVRGAGHVGRDGLLQGRRRLDRPGGGRDARRRQGRARARGEGPPRRAPRRIGARLREGRRGGGGRAVVRARRRGAQRRVARDPRRRGGAGGLVVRLARRRGRLLRRRGGRQVRHNGLLHRRVGASVQLERRPHRLRRGGGDRARPGMLAHRRGVRRRGLARRAAGPPQAEMDRRARRARALRDRARRRHDGVARRGLPAHRLHSARNLHAHRLLRGGRRGPLRVVGRGGRLPRPHRDGVHLRDPGLDRHALRRLDVGRGRRRGVRGLLEGRQHLRLPALGHVLRRGARRRRRGAEVPPSGSLLAHHGGHRPFRAHVLVPVRKRGDRPPRAAAVAHGPVARLRAGGGRRAPLRQQRRPAGRLVALQGRRARRPRVGRRRRPGPRGRSHRPRGRGPLRADRLGDRRVRPRPLGDTGDREQARRGPVVRRRGPGARPRRKRVPSRRVGRLPGR